MSGWIESGSLRGNRGGSWDGDPLFARITDRSGSTPGLRLYYLGFRLLRRVS